VKFNGVHQILVYADGVDLLSEHVDKIKRNTDTPLNTNGKVYTLSKLDCRYNLRVN
jgi:hypothetical protein